MGSVKWKNNNKTETMYKEIGRVEGIKIIVRNDNSCSTPYYAGNSNMYATVSSQSKKIVQISAYNSQTKEKEYDIDWGHSHKGIQKGQPHKHIYVNGTRQDSELTNEDLKLYNKLKDVEVDYE